VFPRRVRAVRAAYRYRVRNVRPPQGAVIFSFVVIVRPIWWIMPQRRGPMRPAVP